MFEEVPRQRSGFAGLVRRRIVLGPFAVGGGMLLATVGGSVAVAATVITASSLHVNDLPPKPVAEPPMAVSTTHPATHSTAVAPTASTTRGSTSAPTSRASGPSATGTELAPSIPATVSPSTTEPSTSGPGDATATPTAPSPTSSTPAPTASAATSPPVTTSPVGNALIYLDGYDQTTKRVRFAYAVLQPGAGPGGSDLYVADLKAHFTATLSATISITSGKAVCAPVGASCTPAELIAATEPGFFAQAGIASDGELMSVVEVDNLGFGGVASPPASTTSPTPTPSASPSASSAVSNASPVG